MSSISSSCCASSAVRRREWWKALPARPNAIVAMPSSDHRIAFGSASTMSTRSPAMPVVVAGAAPSGRRALSRRRLTRRVSALPTVRTHSARRHLRGFSARTRRRSPPAARRRGSLRGTTSRRRRRRGRGCTASRRACRDRRARGRRRASPPRAASTGAVGRSAAGSSTFGSGAISTFGSGGNSTGGSGTGRPPAVLTAITNVVKPTIPTESAFLGDRRRVADA